MEDSGKRQNFDTGAVRDTAEGKSRPDLISPYAQMRKGLWLALGAQKYAERNWEQGMPISRCIASMERHIQQYKMGMTNEDHLAAIAVNAEFIMHYEEMIKRGILPATLDDMPKYEQQDKETADTGTIAPLPPVIIDAADAANAHNLLADCDVESMCTVKALRKSSYTAEEQKEIIANIMSIPVQIGDADFLTVNLMGMFTWGDTPQGHRYWAGIHKVLYEGHYYD
jgi:hypothetical protein